MRLHSCLLLAGVLLLAGCQTARPLYHWGNYENVIYLSYAKPDKVTLPVQLDKLKEDVDKAAVHHSTVHPGLHAQLGYVFYQLGQVADAVREFEAEKRLFPESAPFMDRMIARANGGPVK